MSQVGSGLPRLLAERYELSERLAASGMTSIWRGHDRVLGRDVAVKVLHPELAADPTFRARFFEEAVNAARLTHPNVVALYDTGEQNGVAYIVSEWVEGANLADLLARHGPLPPPRAARLATEVAAALDYAHDAGVLHRGLKPANILVTMDGTVKVGDFSIARAASGEDPERTGEILGSTEHLAPEQVDGDEVDGRTDVYALGVCLFEMLTGRPPPAHGGGSLRSPRALRAGIPRDIDAVVARAMDPDPAERFQTAGAMASALAGAAADDDTDPDPEEGAIHLPQVQRPTPRRAAPMPVPLGRRRRPPAWLGWALVLSGLAAVAVAVALVLVQGIGAGGGGSKQPRLPSGTSAAPATGTRLPIVAAHSLDPEDQQGGEGDQPGQENEKHAGEAFDSDTSSAWETQGYRNRPDFGGLKKGLGLVLELGSAEQARILDLRLSNPGATVTIYGADGSAAPTTLDGWRQLTQQQVVDRVPQALTLNAPSPYRFYLIWFTQLPRDTDGKFRSGIATATLKS
ncbi:MAG TPA: protein kinase [Actinomycetes bacterium]